MSASESYSDNSSTSFDSDLDVIEDYELEVEEFVSPSEQDKAPSTSQAPDMPEIVLEQWPFLTRMSQ